VTGTSPGPIARVHAAVGVLYREMLKFGAVGAVAFVTDVGLFNLFTTGLWPGDSAAPLDGHEKLAKIASAAASIIVAWLGNRFWTFRHRRQASARREFMAFLVMNLVGILIAVACLTISHDLLDFTSALADNISGNFVGIGLGTLFRFWAYQRLVFPEAATRSHAAGSRLIALAQGTEGTGTADDNNGVNGSEDVFPADRGVSDLVPSQDANRRSA
jgi:putative flippase GtrA